MVGTTISHYKVLEKIGQGGDYLYLYEVVNSEWQVTEERLPF